MNQTKQEFVIAKKSLSDDTKWRERRSGTSRYLHQDFRPKKAKSRAFAHLSIIVLTGFLCTLLAAFIMSTSVGDGIEYHHGFGTLTANDILVLLIVLCFVVLATFSAKKIAQPLTEKINDLNFVVITWEPFDFYVGSKGICLDGGIVNYYLEWEAILYIHECKDEKLDFINPDGMLLTTPKRFFDADGRDISWAEFLDYVRDKCRNADWVTVK